MRRNEDLLDDACEDIKKQLMSEFRTLACMEMDDALDAKLEGWMGETLPVIDSMNPLAVEYRSLGNAKRELGEGIADKNAIMSDADNFASISESVNRDFWKEKAESTTDRDELLLIRTKLIENWEGELDKAHMSIILAKIDELRNKFVKSLEEWLKLIESVKSNLDKAGLGTGYLWDMSVGNLTNQDMATLKTWADAFNNDPQVRKICEILGRMNSVKQTKNELIEKLVGYSTVVPDFSSKEEVCGIELGNDLENVLPSELSQMNDPDCDILFTLKFVESRLMCFSKQGYTEIEEYRTEMVSEEEEQDKGPIIFCIDTSGSMSGTPEFIAKAVTLYIAMSASSQKRNCFLINFSTSIETLDLTPPKGIKDLLNFIRLSFHGGTDASPALKKAVEMTNTESYRLADVIVISDFVMPSSSLTVYREEIEKAKKRKCRFHSLTVGRFDYNEQAMKDIFDERWGFDTGKHSVVNLNL